MEAVCEVVDAGGCPGGSVAEGAECCVYTVADDPTTDALSAIQRACSPLPSADPGSPTPAPDPTPVPDQVTEAGVADAD